MEKKIEELVSARERINIDELLNHTKEDDYVQELDETLLVDSVVAAERAGRWRERIVTKNKRRMCFCLPPRKNCVYLRCQSTFEFLRDTHMRAH